MDYTQQSLFFKLNKTLRYIRLYGLSRTLVKIKGQYHMKKKYSDLPLNHSRKNNKAHVGILGCGNFGFSNIAYYLRKNYGNVIKAAMDIDINRTVSLYEEYKIDYYTQDPLEIINDPQINLVYVASNHASHAEYAIKAIEKGKAVHIEKPHAVNLDQLIRLCNAIKQYDGKVRLGFNRPKSKLGLLVSQALNEQTGTTMINWFVAGHQIEESHWYFSAEEGGRVLGNLCHWTDLTYNMISPQSCFPITIIPARAEKSDCDISVSYVFGDGSIATITFSAKGHTFEGVRETLNAHKGNVLLELKDFQKLRIDNVDKVTNHNLSRRDHGHKKAIVDSYKMLEDNALAEDLEYIWNTGYLVIKTREALEQQKTITIQGFEESYNLERDLYSTIATDKRQ